VTTRPRRWLGFAAVVAVVLSVGAAVATDSSGPGPASDSTIGSGVAQSDRLESTLPSEVTASTLPSEVTVLTLPLSADIVSAGARAAEEVDRVLHVDTTSNVASDNNPGSEELPLATIQAAIGWADELRREGEGVRILIQSGIYREALEMVSIGDDPPPLIIEAAMPGTVTVSGSDEWEAWTPAPEPGLFVSNWPYKWGADGSVEPIVGRREMVFISGEPLRQVLEHNDLAAGSFLVDEKERALHIYPPDGIDLASSTVEVGVRPRLLFADGIRKVTIRGITFQHAVSPFDSTAVEIVNAQDVLLQENLITLNSWTGLGLATSTHITLSENRIDNNGGGGVGAFRQENLLMEGNRTSYNNWRGFRGGYVGWSIAGVKVVSGRKISIVDHTSTGNRTRGLWLDYDLADVAIERADLCENLTDGLMIEAVQGPIDIREATICNNNRRGIVIVNTIDVSISGSRICDNQEAAIHLDAEPGGRVIDTGSVEILLPVAERLSLQGNHVGGSLALFVANLSGAEWTSVLESFYSDHNVWAEDGLSAFRYPGISGGLDRWQQATSQDKSSKSAPPGSC